MRFHIEANTRHATAASVSRWVAQVSMRRQEGAFAADRVNDLQRRMRESELNNTNAESMAGASDAARNWDDAHPLLGRSIGPRVFCVRTAAENPISETAV